MFLLHRRLLILCALACGTAAFAPGESSQGKGARPAGVAQTATSPLEPCEAPGAREGVKEKARCGTYEVFENPASCITT
jgi:hypothetical protein